MRCWEKLFATFLLSSYFITTLASCAKVDWKGHVNVVSSSELGYDAFHGCKNLKSVTIASDVEGDIGEFAFSHCYYLESIEIKSNKIKNIKEGAFIKNMELKELIIPDSVEVIGKHLCYM